MADAAATPVFLSFTRSVSYCSDIVGTQRTANRIFALRNTSTTSTFSFAAQQNFSTVSAGPYRLKMADFDKDGKIDFVMPIYEGARTCVFRNTSTVGTINFATPLNLIASSSNYRVGVGDVNGDGLPDVVTKPNGVGAFFQVFLNTSTGPGVMSFNPFIQYNSAAGSEVGGIAIGDMDGAWYRILLQVEYPAIKSVSIETRVHKLMPLLLMPIVKI